MRSLPIAGMVLAGWVVTLLAGAYVADGWLARQHNPNMAVETRIEPGGAREVELEPNRNGHFVLTVTINGEPVEAMIDTGATDVSIPGDVAERLSLDRGPQIRYQTAGGPVNSHLTELERVAVGDIALHDVRGSVNHRLDTGKVLLGMSFLRHLEFTHADGRLVLREPPDDGPGDR